MANSFLERSKATTGALVFGKPNNTLNQFLLKPIKPKKFNINIKSIQQIKEDDSTVLKI